MVTGDRKNNKEIEKAMRFKSTLLTAGTALAVVVVSVLSLGAYLRISQQESDYALGKKVYDTYCASCHGMNGDGNGPDAVLMSQKPCDFRDGVYQFRSTPRGDLPLKSDIIYTLEHGVRTTAMLPQLQLTHHEMEAVAGYVMSFSDKFKLEPAPTAVMIPAAPAKTDELVQDGRHLFMNACAVCHGTDGEGDGPVAGYLKDYKGRPIMPANLTVRPLRQANTPDELYKRIATGLNGTPMAGFNNAFTHKQIWSLVYYIESIASVNEAYGKNGPELVGEEVIGKDVDPSAYEAWVKQGMK
jgi:cytochrome c oxidase cbb3-type subunit 2